VLRAASIGALILTSSGGAWADDSPAQKVQTAKRGANLAEPSGSPIPATPTDAKAEQLAAAAYQKALEDYAQGDVSAALGSMRESFQLSKRAELLYNLAQLEEELKSCDDALADYRRYLELVPQGHYREAATQAQERLERTCPSPGPTASDSPPISAAPAAKEQQLTSEQTEPSGYWTMPRIVGWSAIGTAAVTGGMALYFHLHAVHARDELQQSEDIAESGGPAVDMTLQDQQHRYNRAAIGLGITSGVLVATGALLLLLDPGDTGQRAQTASVCVFPGWVGANYTQRF